MDWFFVLHAQLDREGPGDDASTARAFDLCRPHLPARPRVLDIGCGPGAQTRALARLAPQAQIFAFDLHLPFLRQLARSLDTLESPAASVTPLRMSMFAMGFAPGSFDLIWSEGAIYIRGFDAGLRTCWDLLKPGGCLAVTELSWLQPDPPAVAASFWAEGYPEMRSRAENQSAAARLGYHALGSFVLPDHAWVEHYYEPIARRAAQLERETPDDPDLRALLAAAQLEFDTYRSYSHWYGYVFYILQKP